MKNKWEKASASHDTVATKMSSTWTGIFSVRESRKEERYKQAHVGCGKEENGLRPGEGKEETQIEREKIELNKREAAIKWDLEKARTFGNIEFEKKRLQLAGDA